MSFEKLNRRLNIILAVVILSAALPFVLLKVSSNQPQNDEITRELKDQERAIRENTKAFDLLAKESKDTQAKQAVRDSLIKNEIKLNRDEIKKVRNAPGVRNIANYSSDDITRAFAELERQHALAK